MSFDVELPDGSIVSSSQQVHESQDVSDEVFPMYGIILNVYPSDSFKNYSAQGTDDLRGHRHECTVLAAENFALQPDVILDNVVIPPQRPTGIDNYEEDLPRGCAGMVDGSDFDINFSNIDYGKLDGEWCIVSFVGGSIDHPYISDWWPHPSNTYDLATSGEGNDKKTLKQADVEKNRSRFMRRVNGTVALVNKKGDVYLDTTEANSEVKVNPDADPGKIVSRTLKDGGGSIQIDICSKAQLEFNFNSKERKNPRIGVGSKSQITVQGETAEADAPVKDDDLPHPDQPIQGAVKTRENTRTLMRAREYELIVKSSKILVFADAQGNFQGDIEFVCDNLARMKSGATITLDAPAVNLGSASADQQLVLGNDWVTLMQELITAIKNIKVSTPVGPSIPPVINSADFVSVENQLNNVLSTFVKTKKEHS